MIYTLYVLYHELYIVLVYSVYFKLRIAFVLFKVWFLLSFYLKFGFLSTPPPMFLLANRSGRLVCIPFGIKVFEINIQNCVTVCKRLMWR